MAVKLIASDLDGTLLTNKKELSPRTREALDLAAAAGNPPCAGNGQILWFCT